MAITRSDLHPITFDPILAAFLKIHEKPIIDVVKDYLQAKENADHLLFTRLASLSKSDKNMLGEWLTHYCLSKVVNNESATALELELFASMMAYDIVKNGGYPLIFKLLRRSIDLGNSNASINLAYLYQEGLGVVRSYGTAFNLCSNVYQRGYLRAAYNLAFFYANGYHVLPDNKKALELYYIAAAHLSESAMNLLGDLHVSGTGVEKNPKEAIKWYEMAAGHGSVDALLNLASYYEEGNVVGKDILKSIAYYEQAARRNNATAFFKLGKLYVNNPALNVPTAIANRYFLEARARGYVPHELDLTDFENNIFLASIAFGNNTTDTFLSCLAAEPREQNFETLKDLITQLLEPPQTRLRYNTYFPPSAPRSYSSQINATQPVNSSQAYPSSTFNYSAPAPANESPRSTATSPPKKTEIKMVSVNPERDDFDYAVIKAMVDLFIDNLMQVPHKAPELLKKVAVPIPRTKEEIEEIVKTAFTGETMPVPSADLVSDLVELNSYAIRESKELRFKSNIKYTQTTIAKMVHDASLEALLEHLIPRPNKQTKEDAQKTNKAESSPNLRLFDAPSQPPDAHEDETIDYAGPHL